MQQVKHDLSEQRLTGTDAIGKRLFVGGLNGNVFLLQVALGQGANMIKSLSNLEVDITLLEGALADVVHLLEVTNAVQNASDLIKSLISNGTSLSIKMLIQLLEVHGGDLGALLNLSDDLLGKVVQVLLRVHDLLQVYH